MSSLAAPPEWPRTCSQRGREIHRRASNRIIGRVPLTNGWDHIARRAVAKHCKLDWAEMEERHRLTFETHEGQFRCRPGGRLHWRPTSPPVPMRLTRSEAGRDGQPDQDWLQGERATQEDTVEHAKAI